MIVHGRLQLTSQSTGGLLQLAYGITTVRDLGSDPDVAVSNRDRAQAVTLGFDEVNHAAFLFSTFPASKVLQIATIVPARVMKEDNDYGSVAVGKVADLFVIAAETGRSRERCDKSRRGDPRRAEKLTPCSVSGSFKFDGEIQRT
ncbi:MAG TPA: amidohydrolase family protein [Gemmatimonadaceae bacterium]|nr:amidohydrolase family protein [Gemmatimonadaceae bacterium]